MLSATIQALAASTIVPNVSSMSINILKGNHFIWGIGGAPVRQKLSMILENKVVQKLQLEKNIFYKKWSPKWSFK